MRHLFHRALHHPFRIVLIWFGTLGVALAAATIYSPTFRSIVESAPVASDVFGGVQPLSPAIDTSIGAVAVTGLLAMMSVVGALIFAVPVAWIYTSTRRQEGYDSSFVRMLVGLPVVVAGVVRIVEGDLALAFALAGIVAAVRFRTTVKDLQNAVFAFAVIGIGLATGTGSFVTAFALSVVFCAVAWGVWKLDVGKAGPGLRHAPGNTSIADALVPGETHSAVTMGDRSLVSRLTSDDVPCFEEVADRLAHFVEADALRSKQRYDTLLIVYTNDAAGAREHAAGVLDDHTMRHVHVGDFEIEVPRSEESSLCAVALLMRLEKTVDVWAMMDRLECGQADCVIRAAQLKPIKGLRDWLT